MPVCRISLVVLLETVENLRDINTKLRAGNVTTMIYRHVLGSKFEEVSKRRTLSEGKMWGWG